jgi:hypothetical protein
MEGFGKLIRFDYRNGQAFVFEEEIVRISPKGRIRMKHPGSGISVYQGIKISRLLNFNFTPVRPGWWVLMCFESQRKIGAALFKRRVEKLERTQQRRINPVFQSAAAR